MNTDEKIFQYLVLGGLRHREVWQGPLQHLKIELPAKPDKRLGKFYSRETKAEVTAPLNDTYFVTEFSSRSGSKFMIASTEPLSFFDVEAEIQAVNPPLQPVE